MLKSYLSFHTASSQEASSFLESAQPLVKKSTKKEIIKEKNRIVKTIQKLGEDPVRMAPIQSSVISKYNEAVSSVVLTKQHKTKTSGTKRKRARNMEDAIQAPPKKIVKSSECEYNIITDKLITCY